MVDNVQRSERPARDYQVRICNVSNSTGNCVAQDTILKPFTIVPPLVTLKPASGLTGVPRSTSTAADSDRGGH